ncbi:MAG: LPP20 family lipoprotein [Treponemataceae bacterium]|nr:LPP20 family lipoprotein [Treponemataceae bacterium]
MKFRTAKKIFSLILCVMLCASFAFAAKKAKVKATPMPDWVTEPASVYPSSNYYAQVGYDADRSAAEVKACTLIASIFSQDVKSNTKASSRMVQAEKDGLVSTGKVSSISQDVTREVDAENLIGVEIKGAWFSPKENLWYCIAVLDKPKATDIYKQFISQNNEHIEELLGMDYEDEYSLEHFACVDFASEIASMNEKHLERLTVINSGAANALRPECRSAKELNKMALDIAKQIPIAVVINGDVDGRIRAAFSGVITKAGFRASINPKERYALTVDVSLTPSTTTDGKTARCQYSLTGSLMDNGLDEELLPVSLQGRGSDVDYSRAQNKAISNIEKKDVDTKFAKEFDKYLRSITVE